jgi:hypothetical protein
VLVAKIFLKFENQKLSSPKDCKFLVFVKRQPIVSQWRGEITLILWETMLVSKLASSLSRR